ncbi:MAG: WYL domain-containing protein [Alcaligenaceae bacterium]|nr:MAG: WYL domain-containing protein [Alcaligenaceae bacterium]
MGTAQVLAFPRSGKTASELAAELADLGYTVSKRTVERDLEALERLFPLTHEASQPYGWHWVKGSSFSVMGLSTTEALSLHLLERFLKPLLPTATRRQLAPAFDLATAKLDAQRHSNPLGNWSNKVAAVDPNLSVIPPQIDSAALQVVQESLLVDDQVEIDYLRPDALQPQAHVLNPLGLVQCGPITYLVATPLRHDSPRLYAMHRVKAARKCHVPATLPPGFSLQAYIDGGALQFGEQHPLDFQAWVSEMLGTRLMDSPLSDNQKLERVPGGYVLTATLNYSWKLRWWILSKTGDVEVLAPAVLRAEVGALLNAGAARYAGEPVPQHLRPE